MCGEKKQIILMISLFLASINGDQLGECVSAKKYSHNWDIHILNRVIVQDDKTLKINYRITIRSIIIKTIITKKSVSNWGSGTF